MTISILQQTFTSRYQIVLLTIFQFFCVFFLVIGFWPAWVIWLCLVLQLIFIFFQHEYFSLLLFIVNLPLYLTLPLTYFAIPEWRILLGFLFVVWVCREIKRNNSLESFSDLKFFKIARKIYADLHFFQFKWDKYLAIFFGVCVLSIFWAHYPSQAFKQILFWANIYFFYLVFSNVVKTKEQVVESIKFGAFSLFFIVFLGYFQLVVTFFSGLGVFWVYWASFVSKIYYGVELSKVLLYSNSWFSYTGGREDLRMFSIMPDSHSFAMLAVYAMTFLLPLTYLYRNKTQYRLSLQSFERDKMGKLSIFEKKEKRFGFYINYALWSAIRFCGLAVILSGTRAIWVGLLVPLFLIVVGFFSNFLKGMAKKVFWPFVIIILFFAVSPLINQGLRFLRASRFEENFLDRFSSSFNLGEASNIGRMQIWKSSLLYAYRHPLGTGLGNFAVTQSELYISNTATNKPELKSVLESHNSRYNLPQKYVTAHNLYLHILVEVSILGLVAFLWFWLVYFRELEKFVKGKRFTDNFFAFFVVEIGLTFLWFLASAMFDVTFFNDKVLIYFFLSLALSGIIIKNYSSFEKNA